MSCNDSRALQDLDLVTPDLAELLDRKKVELQERKTGEKSKDQVAAAAG
jgi:hypothetical protein